MAHRKRKIEDFDPNKSDSDDLDYGAHSASPGRPQKRSRKSKASASASRKPPKRRRDTYGDSGDDIELDSADPDSDEVSFQESSEAEDSIEVNPRTGRRVRSSAKKPVKYEEPSDEEPEAEDSDSDGDIVRAHSRSGQEQPETLSEPLLVKLPIPIAMDGSRVTRARGASRPTSHRDNTPQVHPSMATRRSSRISHDEQQPLVALSDSGKHEQVTRPGTATPEPQARRPSRGAKGLKKPPSAIIEVSQEDLEAGKADSLGDGFMASIRAAADDQAAAEAAVEDSDDDQLKMDVDAEDEQVVQESVDDEDDAPVARGSRTLRTRRKESTPPTSQPAAESGRRTLRTRKPTGPEPSSDFEPDADGDAEGDNDLSESDDELLKPPTGRSSNDESGRSSRRSGRLAGRSRSRRHKSEEADEELDPDEIADEAADLEEDNRRNRRDRKRPVRHAEISYEPNLRSRGAKPDYRIIRPELWAANDDDDAAALPATTPTRSRRTGGGAAYRSLFSTFGPFGGAGGLPPIFGGPAGAGATGGVDSDSSDDENAAKGGQQGIGGTVGMTPTSAFAKPFVPQTLNTDPVQGAGGGPPGLGKVKDRKALADADPLGVDTNVKFDGVGGLDDHIDRLKEMVALPLLYPEVFTRFHVTPPRGVLFHGPPGTGKTLLARALASSVSSGGKKVTFYMRKGADALSKWVGEAEKQLRLLFEEARKNQPSIIFFDEIDGLAPVRSSKQEQIHASIVATLLALMDGMDGRGQVIVIGATNRPDSVDPALRRPGRFDREFYFPLPEEKARRAIIDIHTKGWDPPLQPQFKDQLAGLTRGYGGADLRALCTEAALNAVQGTFPQIYKSDEKLIIDPTKIKVLAKDFMISVNKMIPSSERSGSAGAAPLRKDVEPLLRAPLADVTLLMEQAIPRKRKLTALEEAMFDDREDERGFEREAMQRQFESARVFRPRLLISGAQGMGQQYLGAALLNKLEGLHVQHFDLATLMKDSTRSIEAAIIQQFEEVKRHKPSVIFIPSIDIWWRTLGDSATRTFTGLLKSLPPTEAVLLLGVLEESGEGEDEETKKSIKKMMRDLFGYSARNLYEIGPPEESSRTEYFDAIIEYIRKEPSDFPDESSRKRRKLDTLPLAPVSQESSKEPSKADLKAQKKKDRVTLNMLKLHIGLVMDQIKLKYRKFRTPIIDDKDIAYLYDEQDPEVLTTDLSEEQRQERQLYRPYELDKDEKGVAGLRETATGRFFYNIEIVTIEKRLSNGYYKRPKDFLADIKHLAKDARMSGDQDRTLKANEMLANVEVDMASLEQANPALVTECEAVYQRDRVREEAMLEKAREAARRGEAIPTIVANIPPGNVSKTTTDASGPVVLGQEIPGVRRPLLPFTPGRQELFESDLSNSATATTNGGAHTNGSTVPSRLGEDTEMRASPEMAGQPQNHAAAPPLPPLHSVTTPSQPGIYSQKSAHTRVAQGSQLEQYQNSASTTTSGQKTSEHRSSGPISVNTQATNGFPANYFAGVPGPRAGSQLPDTQPDPPYASSQSQASPPQMGPPPLSQPEHGQKVQQLAPLRPPPLPAQHRSSLTALLNEPASTDEGDGEDKELIIPDGLEPFLEELVRRTSGLSVEQLEQVSASMMAAIWLHRSSWNRNAVLHAAKDAFNNTVKDIEDMQYVFGPSPSQERA